MKIEVSISGQKGIRSFELNETATPMKILELIEMYPDEVIITSRRNGNQPLPINSKLKSGDILTIFPVASGG